jgi:hypothetical protein
VSDNYDGSSLVEKVLAQYQHDASGYLRQEWDTQNDLSGQHLIDFRLNFGQETTLGLWRAGAQGTATFTGVPHGYAEFIAISLGADMEDDMIYPTNEEAYISVVLQRWEEFTKVAYKVVNS